MTRPAATEPPATSPHEGSLAGKLGTRLYYRWRPCSKDAAGILVFVHGLAEHSGRYEHVFERFAADGYHCLGFDLRGHGQSEGRRVYVNRFSEYVADTQAAVTRARQLGGDELPLFVVGHSMGGLVALTYLLDHPGQAAGGVLSSPGLANAIAVPAWKDVIGKGLSRLWPTFAIPTGIGAELVSRDVKVVNAYDADPLVTSKATARWYTEMLAAQDRGLAQAASITAPLLVLAAGQDKLVDTAAMEAFVQRLGSADKSLQRYPDLYHEVFNEPEKESVFVDVLGWLKAHS